MKNHTWSSGALLLSAWAAVFGLTVLGTRALGQANPDGGPPASDTGWPRTIASGDDRITVYQPQLEKWDNDRLEARAAVSVQKKETPQPAFGVIWFSTRTEVDKENRVVHLNDFKIERANFPAAADKGEAYLAALRQSVPQKTRTISLDRLEANLAVTQAESAARKVPLKNEPPKIYYKNQPALLVLVDGKPILRKVDGTNLLRAINTRNLLLFDEASGKYYLHMAGRWLEAKAIAGPWSNAKDAPAALEDAKKTVTMNQPVDLLDELPADMSDALDKGVLPVVLVSTEPAELIETQGQPQYEPIDGTQLLWVKNTSSQLLLDISSQNYYVLLSGRWFRSKALEGAWDYVPGAKLPADVAAIPINHPKGDVLASVPGTPQAKELSIANQVPQTATVKRSEAKLTPVYDGPPQFGPIEGTPLQYALNAPTPVIRVNDSTYYAVENGVWFTAGTPQGPWTAATSVPPVIYQIPPSSPIYNVTSVQVYGSTPEVVYVGYTPGYFGTCVEPAGCVVYGTGWAYRPWIGSAWYGRAWTYGFGVGFGWSAAGGWGFGFGAAGRPWWGPVGWNAGWGGNWRSGWEHGWGGRYNNTHVNNINFNNFNAYNRWDHNTVVNNQGNTHTANRTTNVNPTVNRTTNVNSNVNQSTRNNYVSSHPNDVNKNNNVLAGKDGNVYRQGNNGWETHNGKDWQPDQPRNDAAKQQPAQPRDDSAQRQQEMQREQWSRYAGEQHSQSSRQEGGFAGYSGNRAAGYNAGGGRRR